MTSPIDFDPGRIPRRWDREPEAQADPAQGLPVTHTQKRHSRNIQSTWTHTHHFPALRAEVMDILSEHHFDPAYASLTFVNLVYELCQDQLHYALYRERMIFLESVVVKLACQMQTGMLMCA